MPVPGPMRMQGWEGSLGSWKLPALKGTDGEAQSSDIQGWMHRLDRGWGAEGAAELVGGGSVVGVEKTTSSNLIFQVLEAASFPLFRHTLTSSWPSEKRLKLTVLWALLHCVLSVPIGDLAMLYCHRIEWRGPV